jgi:hypothetical protein
MIILPPKYGQEYNIEVPETKEQAVQYLREELIKTPVIELAAIFRILLLILEGE